MAKQTVSVVAYYTFEIDDSKKAAHKKAIEAVLDSRPDETDGLVHYFVEVTQSINEYMDFEDDE